VESLHLQGLAIDGPLREGCGLPQTDEKLLVARFVRGDRDAFDQIVSLHGPRVTRLAYRLLGWQGAQVEDVVLPSHLRAHTVLIGHGRVGGRVAAALGARGLPYVVVEADLDSAASLLKQSIPVVYGDAARPGVLEHAGIKDARLLVVTAPDAFQARAAIELARRVQPEIDIVVRTHSDSERLYLEEKNVGKAVMGEHELAEAMARYALERLGTAPG